MKGFILIFGIFLFFGCAADRQFENYKIPTTADLTLTAQNHVHGYTRAQCFGCHSIQNIHQVDRLKAPNFNLAKPLVEQYGISVCASCHGTNGVAP